MHDPTRTDEPDVSSSESRVPDHLPAEVVADDPEVV